MLPPTGKLHPYSAPTSNPRPTTTRYKQRSQLTHNGRRLHVPDRTCRACRRMSCRPSRPRPLLPSLSFPTLCGDKHEPPWRHHEREAESEAHATALHCPTRTRDNAPTHARTCAVPTGFQKGVRAGLLYDPDPYMAAQTHPRPGKGQQHVKGAADATAGRARPTTVLAPPTRHKQAAQPSRV
jgi:hypothetical protein